LRGISGLEEPIGAERSEGSDHFLVGLLIRHSISSWSATRPSRSRGSASGLRHRLRPIRRA
jgi:hypothetical protein